MLFDLILDRKYGVPYNNQDFKEEVRRYLDRFDYIDVYKALFYASEDKVKDELCKYIDDEWYGNPLIKDYIRSVSWT